MKASRIVAYNTQEVEEEDEELRQHGWIWMTDPDGRVFYRNERTNEKSWTTPLRLEECDEVEENDDEICEEPQEEKRMRITGKQTPPKAYLKTMKSYIDDQEEEESIDEDEVTKTIGLQEVYQNLEEWIPAMKSELECQYTKGSLIPRKISELEELQKKTNTKIKTLPSKLVATKKKKPNVPVKNKARLVACGNMAGDEGEKDTYAGGLKRWQIRTKDVCTAFLNAPYKVEGQTLILIPPKVFVKAGLVAEDEVWEVGMAIYGLKESPLLWAKERDSCLKVMKVKLQRMLEGKIEEEEYYVKRFKADANTWHILGSDDKGTKEPSGLLLTYVDDIMVLAEESLAEAFMKRIDQQWKRSPEEVVGKDPVSFCGICRRRRRDTSFTRSPTSKIS